MRDPVKDLLKAAKAVLRDGSPEDHDRLQDAVAACERIPFLHGQCYRALTEVLEAWVDGEEPPIFKVMFYDGAEGDRSMKLLIQLEGRHD